jgi:hypothetical protein
MTSDVRTPPIPYQPGDPCAVGRYLLGPYIVLACPSSATHLLAVDRGDGDPVELGVCGPHFRQITAFRRP